MTKAIPFPKIVAENLSSANPGPACCVEFGVICNVTATLTGARSKAVTSPATACRQDKDGYFWIVGRIDDVLNVAGHRIGTAEVESALVSNQKVAEAAVVGRPDDLKGQALVAFVTVKGGVTADKALREELRNQVAKEIGPVAKPDDIRFAEALPKTRSGKIMRRLLKQLASGAEIKGDTTTLEDFSVLARFGQQRGNRDVKTFESVSRATVEPPVGEKQDFRTLKTSQMD